MHLPSTLRLNPLPGRALRPLEVSPLDAAPFRALLPAPSGAGKAGLELPAATDENSFPLDALALAGDDVFVVFVVIGISNIFSAH